MSDRLSAMVETGRTIVRPFFDRLPLKLRAPRVYWQTREFLELSQYWNDDQIEEYQVKQLRDMLSHCAAHVPYYRDLFRKVGFDPRQLRRTSDVAQIPTLDKDSVRTHLHAMLADNVPSSDRLYFTTGGTMGKPLGLFNLRDSGWRERAFMETQWSRVGFSPDRLRAMLKGAVVNRLERWVFNARENAYIFSNFHMTPENVVRYASIMSKYRIQFLHGYPSSATDFARILLEAGRGLPRLRALLLSSENMYPGQREAIESQYKCRAYTWFGHSENTILAGECEIGSNYHVFPEYGYAEILRSDGSCATEEGETGELVGTSLYNRAMPLVRYRTGDWAVVGPKSCACGRRHRLLSEVRGRWHQEMLFGKHGNRISMTALNMHSDIFDHVRQFQFYQKEKGKVELRIVRQTGYCEQDSKRIERAFQQKMGGSVDLTFSFVHEIPLTNRGKFRFIIQEIPAFQDAVLEKTQ